MTHTTPPSEPDTTPPNESDCEPILVAVRVLKDLKEQNQHMIRLLEEQFDPSVRFRRWSEPTFEKRWGKAHNTWKNCHEPAEEARGHEFLWNACPLEAIVPRVGCSCLSTIHPLIRARSKFSEAWAGDGPVLSISGKESLQSVNDSQGDLDRMWPQVWPPGNYMYRAWPAPMAYPYTVETCKLFDEVIHDDRERVPCGLISVTDFGLYKDTNTVSLGAVAPAWCLMHLGADYRTGFAKNHFLRRTDLPESSIQCHIQSPEEIARSTDSVYLRPAGSGIGSNYIINLEYLMSSFTANSEYRKRSGDDLFDEGLLVDRESVSFPDSYMCFRETRYSIAARVLPNYSKCGYFTKCILVDRQRWPEEEREPTWKRLGILPAGPFTGFAAFQLQLCLFIESWTNDWIETMIRFESVLSIQTSATSLEEEETLVNEMFDPELKRSKSFFKALNLLQDFARTVRRSRSQLKQYADSAHETLLQQDQPFYGAELETLKYNWAVVESLKSKSADRVLLLIDRAVTYTTNLSDGYYNAHNAKETQKSSQINTILLVFTVVTIIFLPPTFVATIFALGIFEAPTEAQTWKNFWTVFGGISGITYLVSGGTILYVMWEKPMKLYERYTTRLRDAWKGLSDKFTRSRETDGGNGV